MFGSGSRQTVENQEYTGPRTYIPSPWDTEYREGVAGSPRNAAGFGEQYQQSRQQQSAVPKEGFLGKVGKYGNLAINALFLAQLAQSFLPSSSAQPSPLYPPPGYNPYL